MNRSRTCIATLDCQVEYQLSSSFWEGGVVRQHRRLLACCASACGLCSCPELVPFGCIWRLQTAAECEIDPFWTHLGPAKGDIVKLASICLSDERQFKGWETTAAQAAFFSKYPVAA